MGSASALVKPPQRRGLGTSTIHLEDGARWGIVDARVYVKRQSYYFCRPPWRAFLATPTLCREFRALAAWRKLGLGVPDVVSYHQQGAKAELAVREVSGAALLEEALNSPAADRRAIVVSLATTLGRVHRAGWSHGALLSEHILVHNDDSHRITLIDLEKARRSRRLRQRDLDRFWRHNGRLFDTSESRLLATRYEVALRDSAAPSRKGARAFVTTFMNRSTR